MVNDGDDFDENDLFISEFDFSRPINRELLPANSTKYVDNYLNSKSPPLPGTVYYYEVRPVIDNVLARSIERDDDGVIRVFSPFENYAFVHRWMVNQSICKMMHVPDSEIDRSNNYRCKYLGPGMSTTIIDNEGNQVDGEHVYDSMDINLFDAGGDPVQLGDTDKFYYDIGYDMFVMQTELGCPYSKGVCTVNGNENQDCVFQSDSDDDVEDIITGEIGAYAYNRKTSTCFEGYGVRFFKSGDPFMIIGS